MGVLNRWATRLSLIVPMLALSERFAFALLFFVILQDILRVRMAANLRLWRRRNNLTQVDAAALLGVSQPYLSLLEKGARPLSDELRGRLTLVHGANQPHSTDDRFRARLSALGYPGFAHVEPARPAPAPGVMLMDALSQPTLDARVTEALPWLVRHYAAQLDCEELPR